MKLMSIIGLLLVPLCIYGAQEDFPVDFFVSMQHTPHFDKNKAMQDGIWDECANRYNALVNNDYWQEEPRIPKKIHQIWIGSQMPARERELSETWKLHNPDWEYKLWTEKEIDEFGLTNRAAYDTSRNYGEKSDIARCEILYREGGLYVDTDFECFKPFDVLHHCCDFFVGINCLTNFEVINAIIASAPGHPILKCYIDNLSKNIVKYRNNSTLHRTGPYYFSDCIRRMLPYSSPYTIIFPTTYFYPWPFTERTQKSIHQIKRWIKSESFGMHHWHVSWAK